MIRYTILYHRSSMGLSKARYRSVSKSNRSNRDLPWCALSCSFVWSGSDFPALDLQRNMICCKLSRCLCQRWSKNMVSCFSNNFNVELNIRNMLQALVAHRLFINHVNIEIKVRRLLQPWEPTVCTISLLISSLLRFVNSKCPGYSLWTWEFHHSALRFCLNQTLWNPQS